MSVQRRAGMADAELLESGELVLRLRDVELRAELADFVRRVDRGATAAGWTELPGPPRSPNLALGLRSADGREAFGLGLVLPAELFETAPRGPLTVAIMLGDELDDPDEEEELVAVADPETGELWVEVERVGGVLANGLLVRTPALRP
jgi:hypothetical protein